MRKRGLSVVLVCVLTACGGAKSPLVDGGPDAGPCDVDAIAASLAGDAGTDCGTFLARFSYMVELDPGWSGGIDCALSAQDAGLPFRLHLTFGGADSDSISVFVRTPDGQSFELSDGSHLPIGSISTVGQESCASFSLTGYGGVPIDDGGIPVLACDSSGSSSVVCTYVFEL